MPFHFIVMLKAIKSCIGDGNDNTESSHFLTTDFVHGRLTITQAWLVIGASLQKHYHLKKENQRLL
jgi:hypothetical protein